jgi:zinc protease
LAYTVQASITQSASEEPGTFVCILGTDERQFARVKELLRAELRRIREEPISDGEVDDVKSYLLGNLPFRFTTNLAFTAEMIEIERFSLGWDYFDQYRQRIASVTSEQVQEMAIKYIHPDRMILVAAGPLDEKGRPIEAAGP